MPVITRPFTPDSPPRPPRCCASRLEEGAELEVIHRRLCLRAGRLEDGTVEVSAA
ncbi:hypothetical protein [Gluconobacter aidae]|uniref:hypothetical protein n=1 Tax=Gluconobacter aidae TaxID=2662454 RepID=UPI001E5C2A31|nr:hypothetical protein [Gluconobacter aidae]